MLFPRNRYYGNPAAIGGGSPSNSAEAQQFFDRLMTPPTAARQSQYDSLLISPLVAAGVWAVTDVLCIAGADSATSLANIRQGVFYAALTGVPSFPAFTVDTGFVCLGPSGRVQSNFNPSTASGNYARNSASIGVWTKTAGPQAQSIAQIGSDTFLYPFYNTNRTDFAINDGADTFADGAAADGTGFWLLNRTASNSKKLYRNGVEVLSGTSASVALTNAILMFGQTSLQVGGWFVGAGLTLSQIAALHSAGSDYRTAVGAIP